MTYGRIKRQIVALICILFWGVNMALGGEPTLSLKKEFLWKANAPLLEERETGSSKGKNVLLSLLLPGAGEWAMGHKTAAKIFLGTEISLWVGFWGMKTYAGQLERDFKAFAALHAGVNTSQKTDQYWIDIGNADNIYDFNERRRVQRNLEATYPETDQYFWQWNSESNRFKYVDLRVKQHNWDRAATFLIGGMILNRLISAIDVIRLIRKSKKNPIDHRQSFLQLDYARTTLRGDMFVLKFAWLF